MFEAVMIEADQFRSHTKTFGNHIYSEFSTDLNTLAATHIESHITIIPAMLTLSQNFASN